MKLLPTLFAVPGTIVGYYVSYHVVKNAAPDYLGYWIVALALTLIGLLFSCVIYALEKE